MKKIIFEKLTIKEKKDVLAGAGPDPASCGPYNDDMFGPECSPVLTPEPLKCP